MCPVLDFYIYVFFFKYLINNAYLCIFVIVGSNGHKSMYDTKWVIDMWSGNKIKIEPYNCFGEELDKLPVKISYNDLTLKEGQKTLVKSILKYGVGIITNVSKVFGKTT